MTRLRRAIADWLTAKRHPYDPYNDPTICGEMSLDPCTGKTKPIYCELPPMHEGSHLATTKHGLPLMWHYAIELDGERHEFVHVRKKATHD